MRRAHPDVILAAVAAGSVGLLFALGAALEPPTVALADAREGQRVAVEARIVDARLPWVELADDTGRLGAFAPPNALVERGDRVRAEGVVSRAERGLVLSIETVTVTLPTARAVREPAELAREPWAYEGARVVVEGDARDGALVGGGARVRLGGDGAPRSGPAIVTGTFAYRPLDASFVLWVESWTRR